MSDLGTVDLTKTPLNFGGGSYGQGFGDDLNTTQAMVDQMSSPGSVGASFSSPVAWNGLGGQSGPVISPAQLISVDAANGTQADIAGQSTTLNAEIAGPNEVVVTGKALPWWQVDFNRAVDFVGNIGSQLFSGGVQPGGNYYALPGGFQAGNGVSSLANLKQQQQIFAQSLRHQVAVQGGFGAAAAIIAPSAGGSVQGAVLANVSAQNVMDDGILFQAQGAGGLGYGAFAGGGTAIIGGASNSTPSTLLTFSLSKYEEADLGVGPVSGSLSRSRDADGNWAYSGGRGVVGPAAGVGAFKGYAGGFGLSITPQTLSNLAFKGQFITFSGPGR